MYKISAPKYKGSSSHPRIKGNNKPKNIESTLDLRYHALVEQFPAIIYTQSVGSVNEAISINSQIKTITGYSAEEWIADGTLWFKIIHEEDQGRVGAENVRTEETGEPFNVEYRIITREGKVIWVHDEAVRVCDSSGKPLFWQGFIIDITERKQAEEEIRRSHARMEMLVTSSTVMMYTCQAFGEFDATFVSDNIHTIMGYTTGEFLSKGFWAAHIHPEDVHNVFDALALLFEHDYHKHEYRFMFKDGTYHWMLDELKLFRDGNGNPLEIFGTWSDITERKQAENELHALIAALTDTVIVYDASGCYLQIASTDPSKLYKPSTEIIGKTVFEVLPASQAKAIQAHIQRVLAEGRMLHLEYSLTIGGKKLWFDAAVSPRSSDTVFWIAHDITNRKLYAEKLRENEVRFRALVEQVPAVIYTDSADKIFHTIYISPQIKTMTGYDPEEWISDDQLWYKMILPEDRDRVAKEYTRTYAAQQASISEYRFLTRDGRVIWVSDEMRLIRNRKGIPLFWQGVMTDITERKQSEQIQQMTYRISHAAVSTTNLDEFYSSIHSILGELMSVENFYIALYDPIKDLLSFPYFIDQYDEPTPPAKPQHGLTEYILRTKKPLWASKQVFSRLIQQGEVEQVGTDSVDWIGVPLMVGERAIGVMVMQSYTEGVVYKQEHMDLMEFASTQVALAIQRKLDQQRIADALEYNNKLIDSSNLGIIAYDASGQCILANEAASRILGGTHEQVIAQNYNHIESWKKSGLLETAHEAVSSGDEKRREAHMVSTFGKEIWLDCRFTPFYSNGEPHLLLSVDDISISKRAEINLKVYAEKLEQSNRDLQEFAYIASHDLQEPLRKVLAFGDRLVTKYGDVLDETGRDYLKRMWDASQRMQTLINDLLGYSRVSTHAQPFDKVDLKAIAQEVVSDLENRLERTQGRVEIGNLPVIEADPTQMHQLLQNLINNALKFHQETIPPIIYVSAQILGDRCQISVKDNGIGFDIQYLDRIFKPFQRLHSRQEYEGSGMGLAICRRIVERHCGEITATSIPGEGSNFIITLPINQPKGDNTDV